MSKFKFKRENLVMIYSMTGYAAKSILVDSFSMQLEIKSVNNRFLDITLKSNDELKPIEQDIRQLISGKIQRGKVDLKCFIKDGIDGQKKLVLNQLMLNEYINIFQQLEQSMPNMHNISPVEMIGLPGVMGQSHVTLEEIKPQIFSELELLLIDYKSTLADEGSKLNLIIKTKLSQMQQIVDEAEPLIQEAVNNYQEKIKLRLLTVIDDMALTDTRFQQEIALFCQKIDVTEEMDRLTVHISEFNKLLNAGGVLGKRLDFICQEMNREANTFGSKSVSIKTTQKAVDLKVLIEQIREQVQNIM